MAAPNIVNVALIRGQKSVTRQVGTDTQVIVFNPPSSGKVLKINELVVSNIDGTNSVDITVDITKDNAAYAIASTVAIPADASLVVISKNTAIYLEESMAIRATASAADDVTVSCSYEELGESVDSDAFQDRENFHPLPLDIYTWANPGAKNNCTIAQDGATGKTPLAGTPMKMSITGTDPHIGTYSGSSAWAIAPAADGETWRVKVWAKASVSSQTIEIYVFGMDDTYTWTNSGGDIATSSQGITTSWAEYTQDITFNNANVAYISTRLDGTQAGGTADIWFDYYQVYKVS